MSERLPNETPRHLRRFVPTDLGPRGLNRDDRIGLWAIAGHLVFFIVAAVLVLGR